MTDFIQQDWNENDSGNTGVSPNGVAGSYSPSSVAPIIRAIRGAAKRNFVRSNPLYTTTGNGAAYTLTYIAGPVSYQKGEIFRVWAHADNTGPATININTLGAKQLLSQHGTPLTAGMITAGSVIEFVFDGTSFLLISNEKSKATIQTSVTINSGSGVSPTLALSPNNVIRAALSSSANGGIAVTLSNANNAIVKSFVMPESGSMTFGGDVVWTAGNDGAGSGLDADVLDGQQGAYYRDLANSTGTLPNARLSGDYNFGALTLSGTLGVQGVNNHNNSHGYRIYNDGVVNGAFYVDTSTGNPVFRKYNLTTGAGEGYLRIDGNGVNDLKYNGNTVWHLGNDGAGSGLDADVLDGQQGTYYRDLANSTGTLPNARISGDYDGIGILKLTNRLEVTGSAPNIVLNDSTAGQWGCRMRVDASNIYFDSISDSGAYAEVFRFELDTKNGFANGSSMLTAANHNHLNIGTSAATARSAMGLGNLATSDFVDLAYNGTSNTNTNYPVGTTLVAYAGGGVVRNAAVTVRYNSSNTTGYNVTGEGTALTGNWRARGNFANNEHVHVQRIS